MSTTVGRVFTGLTRASLHGGIFFHKAASTVRLNSVRPLVLSFQRSARLKKHTNDKEINDKPLEFLSSKASHRTWKVDRTMGSHFQRPWWKVLPISVFATAFLLWCVLRGNGDIDTQLEKQLSAHLPSLQSKEEKEQTPSNSK